MKILVELLHGLGDTVCALPMLKVIRDNYPEAELFVIIKNKAQQDLLDASKIKINKFIYWNIYRYSLIENMNIVKYLRSCKFDYGVNSINTPVFKAKIFMGILKCKKVVGLQHTNGKSFDDLEDKYHFVEAGIMSIREFCQLPNGKIYPQLFADYDDIGFMKEKLTRISDKKPIIGVCIGNGDYSIKNKWLRCGRIFTRGWGIKNIKELIEKLLLLDLNVVLFGGALEKVLLKQLDDSILGHGNLINLVGITNIKQSIAATLFCNYIIGVDTGMQHIAAASGCKTISIFGPTNPRTHGAYSESAEFIEVPLACKYCYGTEMYVQCDERLCLKTITSDLVINRIIDCLNRKY